MKRFFLVLFASLSIGCISNSKKGNAPLLNSDSSCLFVDSLSMQRDQKHIVDSILHAPPVVVDTTIYQFHVTYIMRDNDDVVVTDHFAIADRSIVLSVKRAGKTLVSNREIRKRDFDSIIPREFFDKLQLYTGIIWESNDENIILLINICIPDTDICNPILLSIDSLGHFSVKKELDDES